MYEVHIPVAKSPDPVHVGTLLLPLSLSCRCGRSAHNVTKRPLDEEFKERRGWVQPMTEQFEITERRKGRTSHLMRAITGLSAVAVASSIALSAGVAGATVTSGGQVSGAVNNIVVGSGSSTTYTMMSSLDQLYNEAPGCTAVVDFASSAAQQPFDLSCLSSGTMTAGKNLVQQLPAAGVTPNPFNDVVVEETPIGSSNGILQLETANGNYTALTAKYSYLNSGNAGTIVYY